MDPEPEVIRRQIEQTSSSLKEKLDTLEEKVLGTVKVATEEVEQTVENVKETVETVKESVEGTVEPLKRTFDLPYQVDRHPWLMVGGACLAGFVFGKLTCRLPSAVAERLRESAGGTPSTPTSYSPPR